MTVQEITELKGIPLKDEVDWLSEDPAASTAGFYSEDYVLFIRKVRCEILEYVSEIAENRDISKSDFLLKMSMLKKEWTPVSV